MAAEYCKYTDLDPISQPSEADLILLDIDGVTTLSNISSYAQGMRLLAEQGRIHEGTSEEDLRRMYFRVLEANDRFTDPEDIIPDTLELSAKEWEEGRERLLAVHARIFALIAPYSMPSYKGAPEFIRDTALTKRVAAFTMRNRFMMRPEFCTAILTEDKPRGDFDLIVTKDDVAKPKPAPDGIFRAGHILGIPPYRSVFVGDMPSDMQAAKAAGAFAVGLRHIDVPSDKERLWRAGADYVVGSFNELRDLLKIPHPPDGIMQIGFDTNLQNKK